MNEIPAILALDFDGVICDGLLEYFQTTKRTYEQIWTDSLVTSIEQLASGFYKLRPVIETGWEMPILLRALVLEIAEDAILENWPKICQELVQSERLNPQKIAQTVDNIRDQWIHADLENWLALHRFYPGIIRKLSQILASSTQVYIVTTKEGRFVKKLLSQQGIELGETRIFGKEVKQPKYETLQQLLEIHSQKPEQLWFVEDRLEALKLVKKQPHLQGIKLFLADWGYNTESTRQSIGDDSSMQLLSLEQFQKHFSAW